MNRFEEIIAKLEAAKKAIEEYNELIGMEKSNEDTEKLEEIIEYYTMSNMLGY